MDIPTVVASVATSLVGGGGLGAFLGYRASKYQTNEQAKNEADRIALERERFEYERSKDLERSEFRMRRKAALSAIQPVVDDVRELMTAMSGNKSVVPPWESHHDMVADRFAGHSGLSDLPYCGYGQLHVEVSLLMADTVLFAHMKDVVWDEPPKGDDLVPDIYRRMRVVQEMTGIQRKELDTES